MTVSLPSIQAELGVLAADIQWAVTAYGLTFGGLLLFGGRAADVFGRRRVLVTGLMLFTVGSVVCLLSPMGATLFIGRGVQGFGAALASPAALSLLTATFTERRLRARALATWTAVGASGAILGNAGGGILAAFATWRASFAVLVVLSVLSMFGALVVAPRGGFDRSRKLGAVRSILITAGMGSFIFGMSQASVQGFGSLVVWMSLVVSGIAVTLFAVAQKLSQSEFIPRTLIRTRRSLGFVFAGLSAATVMAVYYFSTFFLQDVVGLSSLEAGLAFALWVLLQLVAAQCTPRLLEWFEARLVIAVGFAIMSAGALFFALNLYEDAQFLPWICVSFILVGLGSGLTVVAASITALSTLRPSNQGIGAALLNASANATGIVALAILIAIAANVTGAIPEVGLDGVRVAILCSAATVLVAIPLAFLLPSMRNDSGVIADDEEVANAGVAVTIATSGATRW